MGLSHEAECRFVPPPRQWSLAEGCGKGVEVLAAVPLASPGGDKEHGWPGQWLLGLQGPALGHPHPAADPHHAHVAPSVCCPCRLLSRDAWCLLKPEEEKAERGPYKCLQISAGWVSGGWGQALFSGAQ